VAAPARHLDLIGICLMRETDDACFAGARLVVDTPGAAKVASCWALWRVFTAVAGTLADLCRRRR
jgi:hypothetical protein